MGETEVSISDVRPVVIDDVSKPTENGATSTPDSDNVGNADQAPTSKAESDNQAVPIWGMPTFLLVFFSPILIVLPLLVVWAVLSSSAACELSYKTVYEKKFNITQAAQIETEARKYTGCWLSEEKAGIGTTTCTEFSFVYFIITYTLCLWFICSDGVLGLGLETYYIRNARFPRDVAARFLFLDPESVISWRRASWDFEHPVAVDYLCCCVPIFLPRVLYLGIIVFRCLESRCARRHAARCHPQ